MDINEITSKGRLAKSFQLEDDFEGFDENTLFEFTNGEYWIQTNYHYSYHYSYRPTGKLYEYLGSTYLAIDGLTQFVPVERIDVDEYTIVSDFNGWTGATIFEMENGEIWKQDSYDYDYNYSFRPKALIYKIGGKTIMSVEGKKIEVKRIR